VLKCVKGIVICFQSYNDSKTTDVTVIYLTTIHCFMTSNEPFAFQLCLKNI